VKPKNLNFRRKAVYLLLVVVVIAAGILSRKVAGIPLIVGDILYAVMMFFVVKFMLVRLSYWKTGLISLLICYLIELSQLYNALWINEIRNTTLGALILGHGFLWSDMAAYTTGTIICILFLSIANRLFRNDNLNDLH